jgi:hypothetical protein
LVSQTETAESVVLKAAVIDTPTATDPPNTEATLDALLDARATTAAVALTADAPTATNTASVTDTPASTDTPAADTPTPTETPTPNTPDPTETPVASLAVDTPTPTLEPTETPTALPTTTPTLAGPTDTPVPTSTPTTAPTSTSSAPPVSGRIAVPVDNGLGGYNVVVYNVPDGQQLGRIENGHQPAFRADGVKLVVNGEGGGQDNVWEVNGQNYQYERAVSGSPSDFHPFYSPAGDRLVVGNANLAVGTDGNTHPYIFVQCGVRNPQEEGDDRCREAANFGILVPNGQIGEIHGSNPVWTGSDLIVYKGCNTWEGGNSCGIFQVGSWANKRSSNGVTPSKIPGIDGTDTIPTGAFGNSFLYHDRKNDDWEVYLSSVSGGIVNLSNGPSSVDALGAFSPDGQWVAFVSNRDGAWSIWVVAADGGPPSKLFELPWGAALRDWQNERLSWAPKAYGEPQ